MCVLFTQSYWMEGVEICRVARKTLEANISPISVLKSLHRFLKYASSLPENEEKWAVVPEKVNLGAFSRQHLLQAGLKKVALVRLVAIFFAAAVILCLKLKKTGVLIQSCCNNGPRKGLGLRYWLGEKV